MSAPAFTTIVDTDLTLTSAGVSVGGLFRVDGPMMGLFLQSCATTGTVHVVVEGVI